MDKERLGLVPTLNALISSSDSEWFVPLGDDDLLDADFVETLQPFTDHYDIVYGWCRVEGSYWCPNRLFRAETLRIKNYIPATAMIRASLLRELGGWEKAEGYTDAAPGEDWNLWKRALDAGAYFKCVPEVIWTYRRHEGAFSDTGMT